MRHNLSKKTGKVNDQTNVVSFLFARKKAILTS